MAYLYLVYGSEDGPIAIATSAAEAVMIAQAYVTQNGGGVKPNGALAELRKPSCCFVTLESNDDSPFAASATIEQFSPNWYGGKDW